MPQWFRRDGEIECSHLIPYSGRKLDLSLSVRDFQIGRLNIEPKLLQAVSHALMLIDAAQYHMCQAVKNASNDESKNRYYDLMMKDKLRAQDIIMNLAALSIVQGRRLEELLVKMLAQNHERALQIEQEEQIQVSAQQASVDADPNVIEIGNIFFLCK